MYSIFLIVRKLCGFTRHCGNNIRVLPTVIEDVIDDEMNKCCRKLYFSLI